MLNAPAGRAVARADGPSSTQRGSWYLCEREEGCHGGGQVDGRQQPPPALLLQRRLLRRLPLCLGPSTHHAASEGAAEARRDKGGARGCAATTFRLSCRRCAAVFCS